MCDTCNIIYLYKAQVTKCDLYWKTGTLLLATSCAVSRVPTLKYASVYMSTMRDSSCFLSALLLDPEIRQEESNSLGRIPGGIE